MSEDENDPMKVLEALKAESADMRRQVAELKKAKKRPAKQEEEELETDFRGMIIIDGRRKK